MLHDIMVPTLVYCDDDDDNSYSVVTPAEGRPMRATTMDFYYRINSEIRPWS